MAKRTGKRNTIIYILVGLIAVLVVGMIIKNSNKEDGERVMVEKVENRTIKEQVSASGKVFPEVEVKISSDVSGEIVELYVEEGDSVVQGQLLAKIDPDAYQSQVERGVAGVNAAKAQVANSKSQIEQLKAQKAQITAQLTNAREIHERNEKLIKDGVISEADFQASLSSLRGLEANLAAAEANISAAQESVRASQFQVESSQATLRELQTSLRRTTIYAPTSGIVSMLNVEQGERVVGTIQMTGTEMMRIADLSVMEVRVDVSENDIPRVTLGDETEIEIDAYLGRKFKGKVSQIAHSASGTATATASLTSDQVTNFEVRIRLSPESYQDLITPQKQYPFRPGMSASVDITTEIKENVPSVPIQAVTTREKEESKKNSNAKLVSDDQDNDDQKAREELEEVIFLVTPADTVGKAVVATGIQDDTYIEIVSGLKVEDDIVIGPYSAVARKLKSGDKVIRVDPDKFYDQN
ncbi:HlyD family secretion protein [Flavilitoribacter nigricans]|uniref:RND transporter n=1 Tax=Flavilitoribacter nigricans (strain ATCC 23147 / DSM 23189 / NBRC 102662 / NCIMB 1420 / SS-2) TaxID=1122177 RepID=A0A2D0N7H6_FLAN2|nr:efflux RND transporter periplasmic adaptor subunit [Flavilitoribacter nigricans]PHN04445.1 RND transporter [Flavilitoribacter nigricans DSM 23189 = NBRC 102662]